MTLSPQWLDELRARTTLSAVIAPSVKLIKAGREFKACCPFHNEKTPSFTVNDEKGFYHCFGCGAHGDAIRFLTDHRGLPFMDAVKELAGKAGMDVPAPTPRPRAAGALGRPLRRHGRRAELVRRAAERRRWRRGARLSRPAAASTPRRSSASASASPPTRAGKLKAALKSLGEDKLIESGMLIQPEGDGKASYDRFRGRIMFPVRDARGGSSPSAGGSSGRASPNTSTPGHAALRQGPHPLQHRPRRPGASRQARRLIVVEGYMDVIALDRAGIAEAVAPNGTAVTEAQLERMWRLDGQPICCFDGDAAGQKAAVRAATARPAPPRARAHPALRRAARRPGPRRPGPLGGRRKRSRRCSPAPSRWSSACGARGRRPRRSTRPRPAPASSSGLIEHTQAIADPYVRQLYRDEWLRRFDALVRPQQQQGHRRSLYPRREWKKQRRPLRAADAPHRITPARARRRTGVEADRPRPAPGLHPLSRGAHDHVEELAHLRIADHGCAALRDQLVQIAMSGQHLDRDGLQTILADRAAGADVRRGAMRFSFTQAGSNPEVALSDLGAALEAVIARTEIEAALDEATPSPEQDFSESAYAEQQRLIGGEEELQRQAGVSRQQ